MEDLLVIGGGPAGAACALWAHQLGMRTLLLESGRLLGGLQRRSPYPNLWVPGVHGRTGQELAAQLQAHLGIAGVPYVTDSHVRSIARCHSLEGWQVECSFRRYQGRRLVIATGTLPKDGGFSESPTVGIGPGLSMERIEIGGKRVAILGGGDNAFDQARFALRRGARTVDIYCRREPRAQSSLRRDFPPQHVHVGPFKADQGRSAHHDRQPRTIRCIRRAVRLCPDDSWRLAIALAQRLYRRGPTGSGARPTGHLCRRGSHQLLAPLCDDLLRPGNPGGEIHSPRSRSSRSAATAPRTRARPITVFQRLRH